MDYKELVDELRFLSLHVPEGMCDYDGKDPLEKAADAIETILAERDAAVEDIHRDCITCAHSESNNKDHITCKFMEACRFAEHWEWRGPKKGDKHEAD